ncbi:unnamed protein product [Brassica rapa subsp. trilocularis]
MPPGAKKRKAAKKKQQQQQASSPQTNLIPTTNHESREEDDVRIEKEVGLDTDERIEITDSSRDHDKNSSSSSSSSSSDDESGEVKKKESDESVSEAVTVSSVPTQAIPIAGDAPFMGSTANVIVESIGLMDSTTPPSDTLISNESSLPKPNEITAKVSLASDEGKQASSSATDSGKKENEGETSTLVPEGSKESEATSSHEEENVMVKLLYAVLGAGFAGISVAWHLLKDCPKELSLSVDVYDEVGIGGGASGVSGGLLHPYSPKGKLLWHGGECWRECLELLSVAETAAASSSDAEKGDCNQSFGDFMVRRRGILRPATNAKTLSLMTDNARNCLAGCVVETIDKDVAQSLVPNLCLPLNSAFYLPGAMNVNPQRYLQALFLACQNSASESLGRTNITLVKQSIDNVLELEGEYDAVVICLGSKVNFLPGLTGKLPLRTCRGVITHLQLHESVRGSYPEAGPSILSDAWLAVQGPRDLHMGSTWEWQSRNYSPDVSAEEASKALAELLPKASAVYPDIDKWEFAGARAGLRAMPPVTSHGSLPLLGCVDQLVGAAEGGSCKFWVFGGLGSRGLLYHGWLGKLIAKAVLCCKEELLPSELTSWKMNNRVKS